MKIFLKSLVSFLVVTTLISCAKLPIQSVALAEAVHSEGKRMHQINVSLLNKLFENKRKQIDDFIQNEYTPQYIKNFTSKIPEGTDLKKEIGPILQSIIPKINSRRDAMQRALEAQRLKLLTKLNSDFAVFESASLELKYLIESGAKVNDERKKAFEKIKVLSENKLNLNQIEEQLDKFILKSGDVGQNINDLNNTIDSLINN
jgi:hypothetical protein